MKAARRIDEASHSALAERRDAIRRAADLTKLDIFNRFQPQCFEQFTRGDIGDAAEPADCDRLAFESFGRID